MRKLKKAAVFLLAVCMLLEITACGQKKTEKVTEDKSEYQMYYLALSETTLETDDYIPEERTTEAMIKEIAEKLEASADTENYIRLLPENVTILNYSYEGQTVTVNFNEEYKKMKNTREILTRAGIVKAFTQIPGVNWVLFQLEGESMTDSNGMDIGLMDKDTFVENKGENINSYVSSKLNLYFANKDGDRLIKETVWVHYSSNVPLERKVVERLLKGPSAENSELSPTLSPNTKILGVSIVEGICYVNLDKSFLSDSMNVQERLPIYSIVNSLTDACNIHGVQISVEGETKVTFRESMKLDQLYKADYSLMEEKKEEKESEKEEPEKEAENQEED